MKVINKLTRQTSILTSLAAASLGFSGCETLKEAEKAQRRYEVQKEFEKTGIDLPTDHGNGVYTFNAYENFPASLSKFRELNPDLKIISVSQVVDSNQSDLTSSWGAANSFIVVTSQDK